MNTSPITATRFSVTSHLSPIVWRLSTETGPELARRDYAEIVGVPLSSVIVGYREER